jgi:hypothetical protein
MPLLLLLSVFGCQGGDVDSPGEDDSAQPSCDSDFACADDEFCHDDVCQVIDDRSFTIQLGQLLPPSDYDYSACEYEVEITTSGDSCVIHRPADSIVWDAECEWNVDLDEPVLRFDLAGDSTTHSYCRYDFLWDLSGVDLIALSIRSGLFGISNGEYELWAAVYANF